MTVILLSEIVWDKFRPNTGCFEPLLLHFPDYSKGTAVNRQASMAFSIELGTDGLVAVEAAEGRTAHNNGWNGANGLASNT